MSQSCRLLHGDCREVIATLDAASVDAIVTDPPYELGFMGKKWDGTGIAYSVDLWRSLLRVVKPGAHLLAFGGTRTYHRMVCAIEDAGWEIRDCLMWIYGSGFPKSLDVSKEIDRLAGAEREVLSEWRTGKVGTLGGKQAYHGLSGEDVRTLTAPATSERQTWQGWGTALKPAHEPIVLARAPLAANVARNVLEHGTGALNIDGCRIATADVMRMPGPNGGMGNPTRRMTEGRTDTLPAVFAQSALGRWPANVLLDEYAAEELDRQSGETGEKPRVLQRNGARQMDGWGLTADSRGVVHGDSGGASRFFYVAKPSSAERDMGMGGASITPAELTGRKEGSAGLAHPRAAQRSARRNVHPTVKPLQLMTYLCRLITPPSGVILDPFMGSGTTLSAALAEGFSAIGIEQSAAYLEIARQRLGLLAEMGA